METFYLEEESVRKQIATNLLASGMLTHDEAVGFVDYLKRLDSKDLLTVLIESYLAREQSGAVDHYYLIDEAHLSRN